jgi:tRNA (cmo5U34)-methyltransferase
MVAELAADHAKENSKIYDLGCSTGTTLIHMDQTVGDNVQFVGVDDSSDMLDKCRNKLELAEFKHGFDLVVADLNQEVKIDNASVVVLVLTLQFVRPISRERLIKQVFDGLQKDGALILI